MPVAIKVPPAGESVTEATIARWLKKNGEQVTANEPVLEIETDKATQEVPAPVSGVLTISVAEGQPIAIGAVAGQIEPGAAPGKPSTPSTPPPPAKADRAAAAPSTPVAEPLRPAAGVRVSPAARQLAADAGVDLAKVKGSGRGGMVLKEDLQARPPDAAPAAQSVEAVGRAVAPAVGQAAGPASAPSRPASANGRETRQRMTSIRQRIAERLVAAQHNAAILTTFNEADLSAIQGMRAKYKEAFQKKHGVGLGFMSFFVKAAVEALKAFPTVNARIDGNDVVYHHFTDIGVAVSTEKGLMVPVLRDADQMSFAAIEKTIADLATRARAGKISVNDLQGGTFTITNGGVFGSLLSTPLVNPPQSAILGMHAIQKRAVVLDDQVVIRPMMYLALSYDHRLIDGREAVSFLVRIKECVENPERLMLEV